MISGTVRHEQWPLARAFVISRESIEHSDLIVVELSDGAAVGRGEASPTQHYGETVESVCAEVEAILARLAGEDWNRLHDRCRPGAARNAVDCAIWDLRAKRAGRRVWELLDLPEPAALQTAVTI